MDPDEVLGVCVRFLGEDFEEVEFFSGVVLVKVVGSKGSLKFVFENWVFGDVFRDNIGESSIDGFRTDTP